MAMCKECGIDCPQSLDPAGNCFECARELRALPGFTQTPEDRAASIADTRDGHNRDSTRIIADKVAQEIETRKRMAIQSPIVEPIGNLAYCTPETRTMVEEILADDAVHFATKDIIRAGLNRDCLDAARDARLASLMLDSVYRDCTRIID